MVYVAVRSWKKLQHTPNSAPQSSTAVTSGAHGGPARCWRGRHRESVSRLQAWRRCCVGQRDHSMGECASPPCMKTSPCVCSATPCCRQAGTPLGERRQSLGWVSRPLPPMICNVAPLRAKAETPKASRMCQLNGITKFRHYSLRYDGCLKTRPAKRASGFDIFTMEAN